MFNAAGIAWLGVVTVAQLLIPAAPPPAAVPAPDEARRFQGFVHPSKQVVLSAPLDGILRTLAVDEGHRVLAEQVLVRMDDRIQKVMVQAAEMRANSDAEVRRTDAVLKEAEINLTQSRNMLKKGAAADWEVRRAELQRDQAVAACDLAVVEKNLAKAGHDRELLVLEQYTIRAPFEGHVVEISAEAGANLSKNDPILSFVAINPLEAEVFLPVGLDKRIEVGRTYRLLAGKPIDRQLLGRLKTIDPLYDLASQTVRCVFTIDNPGWKMRAGFTIWLADLDAVSQRAARDDSQRPPD